MFLKSLSGRFFLLTIIVIMLAEVLIFVPSVARFRYDYLSERLERAQIASLALLATPNDMVDPALEVELLENADVRNVVLRRDSFRELVLSSQMLAPIDYAVDLRDNGAWRLISDAFEVLWNGSDRIVAVVGAPVKGAGELIEVSLMERPLRNAMIDYGWNILWLSLGLSVATAILLFGAVRSFVVSPINHVVRQIKNFQSEPENVDNIIQPGAGVTELFDAEVALQSMETDLQTSLKNRERLAALGGAVSKISHDLRNILTVTQLLADRMEMSKDPMVQKTAPKLVNSLSRAVNLCERTLQYGKASEPPPVLVRFDLAALVEDVVEGERLAIDATTEISIDFDIGTPREIVADPDQIHRVISNLVRNARQVLTARKKPGKVLVTNGQTDGFYTITVSDDGPGMPAKALDNLFTAFEGGARAGGSGLGLAISAELVKGHDGLLELASTGANGTSFQISLPMVEPTEQLVLDNVSRETV